MRLLVLGGTHHVGRAVVEEALRRSDTVTTVTRGVSGPPAVGARAIYIDRRDRAGFEVALVGEEWDSAIDTWPGAPCAVRDSAALLADRVGHYGFVSSRSVYRWPLPVGLDESAPLADGDPTSSYDTDYAAAKRGGELAVLEVFDGRAVLARAGLKRSTARSLDRDPVHENRPHRGR